MTTRDTELHLAEWQDRLQEAIDCALDDAALTELRKHLDACALCNAEHEKLVALDARLKSEFAVAPTLSVDFSKQLFARIDEHEQARRAAAKQRAEQEFRSRMRAWQFDWREFWQRHIGNIVAAITVIAALIAGLNSTFESARERLISTFDALPWSSSVFALPAIVVAASASLATLALWWLRAKER